MHRVAACLVAVIVLAALPPISRGARPCCCLKAAASCPLMSHARSCDSKGLSCAVKRHDEQQRASIRNDSDLTDVNAGLRTPDLEVEPLVVVTLRVPAGPLTPETPPPRFV